MNGHSLSDAAKKKFNRHGFTPSDIATVNSWAQEQVMHDECMRREEIIRQTLPEQIKSWYINMVTGAC